MDILEKKSSEKNIRYFFLHLYIYIGINLLFIIINLFVGSFAFTWITFLWGIGIIIHGMITFIKKNNTFSRLLKSEIKGFKYVSLEKYRKQKREKEKRKELKKENFLSDELISDSKLIEKIKNELIGIKIWIYFYITITLGYYYVFLISFTHVSKTDIYISTTLSFLLGVYSFVMLFVITLDLYRMRHKGFLKLIKILFILPSTEVIIIIVVNTAYYITIDPLIVIFGFGVLPTVLIFIIRIIMIINFWPKLNRDMIKKYFCYGSNNKSFFYNFKSSIFLTILALFTLIIIFFEYKLILVA